MKPNLDWINRFDTGFTNKDEIGYSLNDIFFSNCKGKETGNYIDFLDKAIKLIVI